jgi:thiol:disulfide interchange protein
MKMALLLAATGLLALTGATAVAEENGRGLYVVEGYHRDADPVADLALAKSRALAEHKRILVEVGGDWCVWCHILDGYLETNPDVKKAYAGAFVVMKVNWGADDRRNEAFLARYPRPAGYPHFYVLDAEATFLHSQNTSALEDGGRSYNKAAMLAFARQWTTSPQLSQ